MAETFFAAILLAFSLAVGVLVFRFTQLEAFPTVIVSPTVDTISGVPIPETKLPPTAVRIPKLNLNIPVQAALVHDNEWDMYDKSVAWLSTSAVPGKGNVILYAHNRKKLFGDLYKLKAGDTVEVLQQNTWVKYTVTESRSITDTDINAILSSDDRLTMYTCEGSFDQKRRVVYAVPSN